MKDGWTRGKLTFELVARAVYGERKKRFLPSRARNSFLNLVTSSNLHHHHAALMVLATQKLTKKQRKGISFRERRRNSNQQPNDVPVMEDQDMAETESETRRAQGQEGGEEVEAVAPRAVPGSRGKDKDKSKGKGKEIERTTSLAKTDATTKTKRKRNDDVAMDVDLGRTSDVGQPQRKKTKGSSQQEQEEGKGDREDEEVELKAGNQSKRRFILFVGMSAYLSSCHGVNRRRQFKVYHVY